ncbi:hypothetical protein HK405_010650, partial [Cladochytrium tenue]
MAASAASALPWPPRPTWPALASRARLAAAAPSAGAAAVRVVDAFATLVAPRPISAAAVASALGAAGSAPGVSLSDATAAHHAPGTESAFAAKTHATHSRASGRRSHPPTPHQQDDGGAAQRKAMRALAHAVATLPITGDENMDIDIDSVLLDDCIVPVAVHAFFDARDQRDRALAMSLVSRLHDRARKLPARLVAVVPSAASSPDAAAVPDALSRAFLAELDAATQAVVDAATVAAAADESDGASAAAGHDADARVVHLCSVAAATLDWSHGRAVVARAAAPRLLPALALALDALVTSAVRLAAVGATGSAADALSLQSRNQSCAELAKTVVAFLSKVPGASAAADRPTAVRLLRAAETVVFGPQLPPSPPPGSSSQLPPLQRVFVHDSQLVAAILLAWILRLHGGAHHAWVAGFFGPVLDSVTDGGGDGGDDEGGDKDGDVVTLSPRLDVGALDRGEVSDYATVAFFRGILSVMPRRTLVVRVLSTAAASSSSTSSYSSSPPRRPPPQATSLLAIMHRRLTAVIERPAEPATRVAAFQTLAAWLEALRTTLEDGDGGGAAGIDVDVQAVLERSFYSVFSYWEDSVDSVQHKLRDVFVQVLAIINLRGSGASGLSHAPFLERMLATLIQADWHRKVKYDLLAHMLGVIKPDDIIKAREDFLDICFSVLSESTSMRSRICAFIVRFFDAYIRSRPAGESGPLPNSVAAPVARAVTSESVLARRAVSEAIIGKILAMRPGLFGQLLH